ncbi:conserved hypothetical protein [Trichinella spiralis]|uniref:hypothetical protein n=1 Tax=Trichinella spiralis TaxID=6334 RepID=UPI0001EFB699|nr:conserved hypothetical protein [Trichinella spiralis]
MLGVPKSIAQSETQQTAIKQTKLRLPNKFVALVDVVVIGVPKNVMIKYPIIMNRNNDSPKILAVDMKLILSASTFSTNKIITAVERRKGMFCLEWYTHFSESTRLPLNTEIVSAFCAFGRGLTDSVSAFPNWTVWGQECLVSCNTAERSNADRTHMSVLARRRSIVKQRSAPSSNKVRSGKSVLGRRIVQSAVFVCSAGPAFRPRCCILFCKFLG